MSPFMLLIWTSLHDRLSLLNSIYSSLLSGSYQLDFLQDCPTFCLVAQVRCALFVLSRFVKTCLQKAIWNFHQEYNKCPISRNDIPSQLCVCHNCSPSGRGGGRNIKLHFYQIFTFFWGGGNFFSSFFDFRAVSRVLLRRIRDRI